MTFAIQASSRNNWRVLIQYCPASLSSAHRQMERSGVQRLNLCDNDAIEELIDATVYPAAATTDNTTWILSAGPQPHTGERLLALTKGDQRHSPEARRAAHDKIVMLASDMQKKYDAYV